MKYLKYTFFLCFLHILVAYSQQENDYKTIKFKHFSLKDGLSQSSVLSITQDSEGFLWFGTRDGLNKYDGYSFLTYRHVQNDSTSLSNNYIKTLFEDNNGNLWVGTQNGLNKFDKNKNTFKRITFNKNKASNEEIWAIIKFDENNILIGTNKGIKKLNINSTIFDEDFTINNTKITSDVRDLFIDSKRNLWIKNINNLEVYNLENKPLEKNKFILDNIIEINSNRVSSIYEDRQKKIWIGYRNGLIQYDEKNKKFNLFKIKDAPIITEHVRTIKEDYLGNLWIGTYKGIYIINKSRKDIKYFNHKESDQNSLSQNSVYEIFEDSKGDIWIGTYAGGINYFDRSYDSFKLFSSGENNSLNYKVVSSIVEDENKDLWIGTEGGGINFYNKKSGKFTYYTNTTSSKSLSANNVKAILKDSNNNLWIGTHDGGLNFLNKKNKPYSFINYKNNPKNINSISSDRVISMLEDNNKNIWIGTSGGGLNLFNTKTKKFTQIKNISAVSSQYIFAIVNSSKKDVIYIVGDKGLSTININTFSAKKINYKKKDSKNSIQNSSICLFQDDDQNLWIGTEGDGLYFYNPKTKESIKYGIDNGLPSEIVYGILPDLNDNLWLSTNQGISKFNKKNLQIKNFDVSDGLQGNEFNYGAYLKGNNGDLYFGGANGLTTFNPDKIVENSFVPQVLITGVQINNKPYKGNIKEQIILDHKQNVFGFNFIALSYSKPKKNQYAYKLEGFDKKWNYVGNRKSTIYTNIDAGKYTFKVKASNSDKLWNEKGAELVVIIKPAPWKTLWAYLIYFISAAILISLFRHYYFIRKNEKADLIKEREEKEKLEEVNALKLQLFTNISHDFRTPLTLIIGPLEKMINENLGDSYIKHQHSIMHKNASVLLQLINQLLDFRKSESGQLKLISSKENFVSIIKDVKEAFNELAIASKIDFKLNTDDDEIIGWFDIIKIKKILYNLISNAFKNTAERGKISINISVKKKATSKYKKGYIKIEIEDTGKGISKENLKNIFNRFYQLRYDKKNQQGTGIGLSLTKNLISLHNGEIDVKSVLGKGTTFKVLFPLGKQNTGKQVTIKKEKIYSSFNKIDFINPNHLITSTSEIVNPEINSKNKDLSTLLIVEDNKEVREFLKNIFNTTYNLEEAGNGKEALEIVKTKDIDLILSDVMMPEMDGIELCKKIKTDINTSHIPIVLLTAKTSKKSQDTGYETGADSYILKPFDPKTLVLKINNLINSRKNLIAKFRKEIILEPKAIAATSVDEVFLDKAFKIVEENISNPDFYVQDLTDQLHMSRSVLYRKIKALTGQSISGFIRSIKLKKASQLIISRTDLNISEIAYELGFNDLKHFRKLFKETYKEPPSQYRSSRIKKQ